MKKITCVIAILCSLATVAQKGKMFPAITGTTLNDKPIKLPVNNGKQTVVAIAYHRGAEDALKKWLNPLYYTFIKKEKGTSTFDVAELYDVNFVFVPMISGFKKIANDFKAGTEKEFWPYIMDTEKSDIKGVQEQLGAKDNKIPYFYILDKDGKVIESVSGDYTEDKMDKLEDAVE
ncbi:MAG: TlpA family protein disulfide reductase [Bacteroidia bacterium]